jgi:hypothetical protein
VPVAGLVVVTAPDPELMEAARDAGFEEVVVVAAAVEEATVVVFLDHAQHFWH